MVRHILHTLTYAQMHILGKARSRPSRGTGQDDQLPLPDTVFRIYLCPLMPVCVCVWCAHFPGALVR